MKLVDWVMAAALFTSSFDIFLVFHVGGTVRFAQFMILFVIVAAMAQIAQSRTILWARGCSALVLWCLIQGLLISQSLVPMLSIQLYVVLLFTVGGMLATLQLYGLSDRIGSLMKVYLASFIFVALFGIFQLVSPSLHLGSYFVQQWITHGIIPRINGFSYEPSYFVTYLLLGWITMIDLRVSHARIVAGRFWLWAIILLTGTLLLSTSKTAFIFVALEGIARTLAVVFRSFRNQAARLGAGSLRFPLPRRSRVLGVSAVVIAGAALVVAASRVIDLNVLLAGSGLNNTAAHSVNTRKAQYDDTIEVFLEHPWIGRSLAGVAGSNAALHGAQIANVDDLRLYWGFPVPVDLVAASGIPGIIPFLWFFLAITIGERRIIRNAWPDERAKWLQALIRALAFEWATMLGHQNVLRLYFWFHVTILVIVGYHLRYKRGEPYSAERLAVT